MHMFSKLAAGSAILATVALGSTGLAQADGYKAKGKVAFERPTDWSGVYFGVSSGYEWSDINFSPVGANYEVTHADGIVGAHLGIQHQFGAVVLGIEGNWISSFRDEEPSVSCFNPAFRC